MGRSWSLRMARRHSRKQPFGVTLTATARGRRRYAGGTARAASPSPTHFLTPCRIPSAVRAIFVDIIPRVGNFVEQLCLNAP